MVSRDQVPTCIEWCKYGKECVGEQAYERYMEAKGNKDIDNAKLEEEEAKLKELMEKAREYC